MPTSEERINSLETVQNQSQSADQLEDIVNYDVNAYHLVYDPSIGKIVKMKGSLLPLGSHKPYPTVASLPDPTDPNSSTFVAFVHNDPNPITETTGNGYYVAEGSAWVKKSSEHENEVNEANTTKGVTGYGAVKFHKEDVFKHTSEISRDLSSALESGINRTRFSDNDLKFNERVISDGTTVSAGSVKCTDFIKLNGASKIVTTMVVSTVEVGLAFYDENKDFLSFIEKDGATNFSIEEIDIPAKAKYLRTTYWKDGYKINDVSFYLKLVNVQDGYDAVKKANLLGQLRLFTGDGGYVEYLNNQIRFKLLYLIDGETGKRAYLNDGTNSYNQDNSITLEKFDSLFVNIEDFVNANNNTEISLNRNIWTGLSANNYSLGIAMSLTDERFMYGEIFSFLDKKIIQETKSNLFALNSELQGIENIPNDSLLDANTNVVGSSAGIFDIRFPNANNSVQKLTDESEDYFKVSLNTDGGSNPAFWSLNDIDSSLRGKTMILKFAIKSENSNSIIVNTDGGSYNVATSTDWQEKEINVVFGSTYNDMRLMFYKNANVVFYLKNLSLKVLGVNQKIEKHQKDITLLKNKDSYEFGLDRLQNYRYKIASLNNGDNASLVIGLHGDSWTHKTDTFSRYTTFIARYLRDKYGNGGGGFYDFGASSSYQYFRSIDEDDANDVRTGTINYIDEGSSALGINCGHAEFTNGSNITLNITSEIEKAVIHYIGNSSYGVFRYRIDGGSWNNVDCSTSNGYFTIDEIVTDNTHTIEFEVTSGTCVILGVDMQRNTGVRVHKFGNRGLRASDVLAVDAELWKAAINAFDLDVFSCLLGTNEKSTNLLPATYRENMRGIYNLVIDANEFVDFCFICPSHNRTTNTYDMQEYNDELKDLSVELSTAFLSLIPLFGSIEKLIAKGYFYDTVHPTIEGGKAIQELICKKIFF